MKFAPAIISSQRLATLVVRHARRLPAYMLLAPVVVYRRLISPLIGPRCRFLPTCSEYAQVAIQRFGAFHGGWLMIKRLVRCHPLCEGGFDPVPPKRGTDDQHERQ